LFLLLHCRPAARFRAYPAPCNLVPNGAALMSSLIRIVAQPGCYHCHTRSLSSFVVASVILGQEMCSLIRIVARRRGAVVVFLDRCTAGAPLLSSPLLPGVCHICHRSSSRPSYLANSKCSLVRIVVCRWGAVVVFPDCRATGVPLLSSWIVARCPRSCPVCTVFIVIHRRLSYIYVPLQQHTQTSSRLPFLPLLPSSSLVKDDSPSTLPPGGKGHATGGKYLHFRRQTSGVMVHAWVGQKLLKYYILKSSYSVQS
jgi:hypothetical protein